MLLKVIGWTLGALILLVFGVFFYWEPLQVGIVAANTTFSDANYTATQQAIRVTPALLIIGVLATPLVALLIYKMVKAQGY